MDTLTKLMERLNINAVQPTNVSQSFLSLPLEIRDMIYRMLLTTTYCTWTDSTEQSEATRFRLHTGILLANKQVSAEATRMMYQGNEFVVLKTIGIHLDLENVPKFKLLSENNIKAPVMRIEVSVADGGRFRLDQQRVTNIITCPEGVQHIIIALWRLDKSFNLPLTANWVNHGDLKLTLHLNIKVHARYEILSEFLVAPWKGINGFKEIVLTGNFKTPMHMLLENNNRDGPCLREVADLLEFIHALGEENFANGEYNHARWWFKRFEDYFAYLYYARPYRSGGFRMSELGTDLWLLLKDSIALYVSGKLKLVRLSLHQSKYGEAARYSREALTAMNENDGWAHNFGWKLHPIVYTKFFWGATLTKYTPEYWTKHQSALDYIIEFIHEPV
jgi:hypothetical protein